jgi:hypothetical protein
MKCRVYIFKSRHGSPYVIPEYTRCKCLHAECFYQKDIENITLIKFNLRTILDFCCPLCGERKLRKSYWFNRLSEFARSFCIQILDRDKDIFEIDILEKEPTEEQIHNYKYNISKYTKEEVVKKELKIYE